MRRRDLLLAGAALSLQACSGSSGARPSLGPPPTSVSPSFSAPQPPSPDAVPKSFAQGSEWPKRRVSRSITALHRDHLCATLLRRADMNDPLEFPAVVDLNTHRTRILMLDDRGEFSTAEADLAAIEAGLSKDQPEFGKPLLCGPAVIDDEAAYLTVHTPREQPKDHVVAHLVKVRHADGQVEASATLMEDLYYPYREARITLSFSPDRSSLLVASRSDQLTNRETDFFGFRLSAKDLSVEFDARDVRPPNSRRMWQYGAAIQFFSKGTTHPMILLANGAEIDSTSMTGRFVVGEWCLYNQKDTDLVFQRNLTTGEEQQVSGLVPDDILSFGDFTPWTERSSFVSMHSLLLSPRCVVWTPGNPTAVVPWTADERPLPSLATVFGNVLFSGHHQHDDGAVTLRSLDTGEVIATIPRIAPYKGLGISAWGLAAGGVFLPANEWISR